jgi:hypothetical protein
VIFYQKNTHSMVNMGKQKDNPQDAETAAILAHALSVEDVVAQLKTNLNEGLSESECPPRLEKYGRNELDGM